MEENECTIKKLVNVKVLDAGKCPVKAHHTDAGFDLFATSDIVISTGEVLKHPLNIQLEIPDGSYGEITSKSGLGSKGLLVYAGIIDSSYRGIPHVVCTVVKSNTTITIKKGDKIAQMIMHPFNLSYVMQLCDDINTSTDRGEGGFGSTGR